MVAAPSNLTYTTITGTFLLTGLDSNDADRYPDYTPAIGNVTFQPDVRSYKNLALPATFITTPVTGTIDAAGVLRDSQGALGVVLVATDNVDLSPRDWTYTVTVSASGQVYSFPIKPLGGQTIDITAASPVPSSTGVQVIVSSQDRILAQQAAQAAAASAVLAASYSGGAGAVADGSITNVKINAAAGITLDKTADSTASTGRLAMTNAERTKLSGVAPGATVNTTVASLSDFAEGVDDRVAALIQAGTGISLAYNDGAGTLVITNTGVFGISADDDNALSLGSDNKPWINGSLFQPAGAYLTNADLKYSAWVWVLENTETEANVPSDFPVSTSTRKAIIMKKP